MHLDVYIGRVDDPEFDWDGLDNSDIGNVPQRLSPFFPSRPRIVLAAPVEDRKRGIRREAARLGGVGREDHERGNPGFHAGVLCQPAAPTRARRSTGSPVRSTPNYGRTSNHLTGRRCTRSSRAGFSAGQDRSVGVTICFTARHLLGDLLERGRGRGRLIGTTR
jgi:hypothetical protein